jgi:hypothetical protein
MAQADKEAVVEPTEMESEASATWGGWLGWLDGDPKALSLELQTTNIHQAVLFSCCSLSFGNSEKKVLPHLPDPQQKLLSIVESMEKRLGL